MSWDFWKNIRSGRWVEGKNLVLWVCEPQIHSQGWGYFAPLPFERLFFPRLVLFTTEMLIHVDPVDQVCHMSPSFKSKHNSNGPVHNIQAKCQWTRFFFSHFSNPMRENNRWLKFQPEARDAIEKQSWDLDRFSDSRAKPKNKCFGEILQTWFIHNDTQWFFITLFYGGLLKLQSFFIIYIISSHFEILIHFGFLGFISNHFDSFGKLWILKLRRIAARWAGVGGGRAAQEFDHVNLKGEKIKFDPTRHHEASFKFPWSLEPFNPFLSLYTLFFCNSRRRCCNPFSIWYPKCHDYIIYSSIIWMIYTLHQEQTFWMTYYVQIILSISVCSFSSRADQREVPLFVGWCQYRIISPGLLRLRIQEPFPKNPKILFNNPGFMRWGVCVCVPNRFSAEVMIQTRCFWDQLGKYILSLGCIWVHANAKKFLLVVFIFPLAEKSRSTSTIHLSCGSRWAWKQWAIYKTNNCDM